MLLRSPLANSKPERPLEWIQLPTPDLQIAAAYARRLIESAPAGKERLAQATATLNQTGLSLLHQMRWDAAVDVLQEVLAFDQAFPARTTISAPPWPLKKNGRRPRLSTARRLGWILSIPWCISTSARACSTRGRKKRPRFSSSRS